VARKETGITTSGKGRAVCTENIERILKLAEDANKAAVDLTAGAAEVECGARSMGNEDLEQAVSANDDARIVERNDSGFSLANTPLFCKNKVIRAIKDNSF
jgi:hypothetical protein